MFKFKVTCINWANFLLGDLCLNQFGYFILLFYLKHTLISKIKYFRPNKYSHLHLKAFKCVNVQPVGEAQSMHGASNYLKSKYIWNPYIS